MSDDELVLGIKQGKENALIELQNKYGRLLYGIVKDVLEKKHYIEDVDECYSDIIVDIWRNIDYFDDKRGKLINFIAAIAKYKSIDYIRKLSKRNEVEIDEKTYDDSYREEFKIEELENFKDLLNILNKEDKILFIKRYYFEEDIEKISKDMKMSKDTVYQRLSRGREKLKGELEGII